MDRRGLFFTHILFLTFLVHTYLFSADVTSKIVSVTVFSDRAMVTRRVAASVVEGDNKMTLQGLPQQLDPGSVRVTGKGPFVLKDVKVTNRFLTGVKPERMKELLKEKAAFQDSMQENNDTAAEVRSEKSFIQNIASMLTRPGEKGSGELDPDRWIKMVNFYREKMRQLDSELRSVNKKISDTRAEIQRVDREIQSIGYQRNRAVKEITVTVSAASPGKGLLDISYLVPGPTWAADYTVQVDEKRKSAVLMYKAAVYQSTGEDWENTALFLSTAKPSVGGVLPKLDPWYLDVYNPVLYDSSARKVLSAAPVMEKKAVNASSAPEMPPEMGYAEAGIKAGMTSVVFAAEGRTSVESDNQGHAVTIALLTLPASFTYSAVPKISPFVFLQAAVTNTSEYPLLAGKTHIFLNGNFVVKSSLKNTAAGEKFSINCGIDEGFSVERKRVNRFESVSGFFTKKTSITYTYRIKLENNKDVQEKVEIRDQLPVSKNREIVVVLLEPQYAGDTPALKKTEDGYITWTEIVGPGKAVTVPFSFRVSFPQNVHVDNLE